MSLKRTNKIKSLAKYKKAKSDFQYFIKISGMLKNGKEIRSRAFGNFIYDIPAPKDNSGTIFDINISLDAWSRQR